jgi:hypothetical protein
MANVLVAGGGQQELLNATHIDVGVLVIRHRNGTRIS